MSLEVSVRNPLHAVYLDLNVSSVRQRVGHLVYGLLVDLHAVDGQAGARVQLFVTNVTLEMFCFLVLNQNLLIVKFSVAIPEYGGGRELLTDLLLRIIYF